MKKLINVLLPAFIVFLVTCNRSQELAQREQLFDFDWKFCRGNLAGAEQIIFNDSGWRTIDLPHDYSIEDLPDTASSFSPEAINGVSVGFTTGGTSWYRKEFSMPASEKGKQIILQFDGIYMNADVWLNGEHLGDHPYGYTSFWFNLSGKLKFSEKNVLAVQVRNEGMNSRWYSGSGIYRHVWLKILEPVHIAQWGTDITTPEVNAKQAKVIIKTSVNNESSNSSEVMMFTRILDKKGIETGKAKSQNTIKPSTTLEFTQEILVESPVLWSIDAPALYSAVVEVYSGKKLSDRMETKFGIRTVSFDAVNGFRLNGKTLKLKGGCIHHDNGPLGSKAFDRAEERRIELLKASGFNAIRCAHNPPSLAFLDACDRLGMLVIDEAFDMWHEGKNPQDYHLFFEKWWQKDAESMILRDRNHPSIILWSIGNEIPGMDKPEIANNAQMLAAFVHKMDPSRPVTAAVNSVSDSKDQYFAALDVCGYNYARNKYETDHLRKPKRIMIATESYPLEAFDYWMSVLDYPWLTGDFVWTAFDYIGEASIGWLGYPQEKNFYPWNLAYCGDIDICGWKRPQSCYRDVLWNNGKVYVFVKPPEPSFRLNPKKETWSIWNWEDVVADWNWKGNEGKPLEVDIYSSCEQVKLFLNGKSLGKKTTNHASRYMAKWKVPYEAGILKVFGYMGDKQIDSSELRTAKQASQIRMTADRTQIVANGQDLSYITIELLDMNGVRDPKAENLIKFKLEGPGTIAGVGNANPISTESYLQPQRKTWQGRCLVVVKSDKKEGTLILKASAEGLLPAQLMISTKSDLKR